MEVNPEAIQEALARKQHALGQAEVRPEAQTDGRKAWTIHFPKAPRRLTPEEKQRELIALKAHLAQALSVGFENANLDIRRTHEPPGLFVRLAPRYEPL